METSKERLQKSIQREIEAREELLKNLERVPIGLIEQAFPGGYWSTSWGSSFDYTLPFDFQMIEQARKFMAEQFHDTWKLKRENRFVWDDSKSAGHFLEYQTTEEYYWDRADFQFAFRTGRDGTTCVLNKIGEKSVPVYEVICGEGAAEMAQQEQP